MRGESSIPKLLPNGARRVEEASCALSWHPHWFCLQNFTTALLTFFFPAQGSPDPQKERQGAELPAYTSCSNPRDLNPNRTLTPCRRTAGGGGLYTWGSTAPPMPTDAGSDEPSGQQGLRYPARYMLHSFTNVMLTRSYGSSAFTHLTDE